METLNVAELRRFGAFDTRMVALTESDVGGLHALTVAVNWPHRPEDIRVLMEVGQGYLICDPIDRALASGFFFPMGADFATVGMMLTVPRLQALGAGSWMLERVLAESGARGFLLNSTRQGYALYKKAGFRPVRDIRQLQGFVTTVPPAGEPGDFCALDATGSDRAAVEALDRMAFGADRRKMLESLMPLSSIRIAKRDGKPVGHAMIRRFGRGLVIGPIVAETEEMAIALIAPMVERARGQHLRVDVPEGFDRLAAYVSNAGLAHYDTVVEMTKGQPLLRDGSAQIMGLAAHAWG